MPGTEKTSRLKKGVEMTDLQGVEHRRRIVWERIAASSVVAFWVGWIVYNSWGR